MSEVSIIKRQTLVVEKSFIDRKTANRKTATHDMEYHLNQ